MMKILNKPVASMHLWAIALLSALAAISSYTLRTFPLPLLIAVAVAAVSETMLRQFYLKQPFRVPYSGLITGLIIGSIAPINSPVLLVIIAVAVAVASKFFIQYRSSNIFNPAAIGLIVSLALFRIGDEWWVASNYNIFGVAVTLTPVLVILAYEARRLPAALAFAAVSFIIVLALSGFQNISSTWFLTALFGINYYFAFVMLVEPKTSPNGRNIQIVYGAALALALFAFTYLRVPYPILVTLLIGNIAYLLYRASGRR